MKIIECVPNFSEGSNEASLSKLKNSLNGISECRLLSFESDKDYNRSVATFIGNEKGILKGAAAICKSAAEVIDMKIQKGAHPRLGAIDVVPFVPIKNTTMEECIKLSEDFGKIISKELDVPVYLYESSARKKERINLSDIRKGEYEGLKNKLNDENWYPDFGTNKFNAKLGAIVTGARFYLIAYNVNLITDNIKFAKQIAEALRESGFVQKDKNEKIISRQRGKLKNLKAIGVYLQSSNTTQVSMNLTNFNITPIHTAFEEIKKEAEKLKIKIAGSEIIGLVPLEALLQAGRFYSKGKSSSEEELINIAIENLGLNSFIKEEKIIDYML